VEYNILFARSLEIPAIVGTKEVTSIAKDGDIIIVDGLSGDVFLNPSEEVVAEYRAKAEAFAAQQAEWEKLKDADRYVGFGLMAQNGGIINAKNNYIKVANGSTAVASVGSNANVDMTGGTVEYKGNGYALYAANGGNIDMTDAKLILDGSAIGYEKVYGTTLPY